MQGKKSMELLKSFNESDHPRSNKGRFISKGKELLLLENNIDTILHGTPQEKEKLTMKFFRVANTSHDLKELGLKGDYFTVKYGVISHHKNKDLDHALTAKHWVDICKKINKPFLVAKDLNGNYRLFVDTKVNGKFVMIGVEVKNAGRNLYVNAIKTAFGKDSCNNSDLLYVDKNITAEQLALLKRTHFPQYPGIQKALKLSDRTSGDCYKIIITDYIKKAIDKAYEMNIRRDYIRYIRKHYSELFEY